jgi:hypothetical protein
MVKLLPDYNGAHLCLKKTGLVPSNNFVKLKKVFFSTDKHESAYTKDYIKYNWALLARKVNCLH